METIHGKHISLTHGRQLRQTTKYQLLIESMNWQDWWCVAFLEYLKQHLLLK
jgi:hypothetical protein